MVISKDAYENQISEDRTFELKRQTIYMINPGSVGQPRDRCPLSSFITFDPRELVVHYHRVEYDISDTQNKLLEAGLSPKLAKRLEVGR